MLEKIQKYQKSATMRNLRDVRFLGFVVFGVLVLLASWSGVKVIETNYELQKQIAQLDERNKVQQLENTNLKLRNAYYNTDTYLELTARKQFGKGASGEKLLLVPKSVALARTKALPVEKPVTKVENKNKSKYQQNLDAWISFFLHRNT